MDLMYGQNLYSLIGERIQLNCNTLSMTMYNCLFEVRETLLSVSADIILLFRALIHRVRHFDFDAPKAMALKFLLTQRAVINELYYTVYKLYDIRNKFRDE